MFLVPSKLTPPIDLAVVNLVALKTFFLLSAVLSRFPKLPEWCRVLQEFQVVPAALVLFLKYIPCCASPVAAAVIIN